MMSCFCLTAVRDEERYLPGFLHHIRDHVDGILALDDCSMDNTLAILKADPKVVAILREENRGIPHANESRNRHRLLVEAVKHGAAWALCADADERFEEGFLRNLPGEIARGEQLGQPVRCLKIVNLWNSPYHYRADGPCGPRWAPRLFKIPRTFTERPFAMHRPWFPPQLDEAPRTRMDAYLYHLRMIESEDRRRRFEKFRSVDPDNRHQARGYDHMIDETNLELRLVPSWRRYVDLPDNEGWPAAIAGGSIEGLPPRAEFDDAFYLNQNPDVQTAVARGRYSSAWQHFQQHGWSEPRQWRARPALHGLDFEAILGAWRDRKS